MYGQLLAGIPVRWKSLRRMEGLGCFSFVPGSWTSECLVQIGLDPAVEGAMGFRTFVAVGQLLELAQFGGAEPGGQVPASDLYEHDKHLHRFGLLALQWCLFPCEEHHVGLHLAATADGEVLRAWLASLRVGQRPAGHQPLSRGV